MSNSSMIPPSKYLEALSPYKITPQDIWSDLDPNKILKLDWNEAPINLPLYESELLRLTKEVGILAWYPDCLAIELTDELSRYLKIDPVNILTFPGSDTGLETLCRAYLNPEDNVAVICPTYENFFVYVTQTGANISRIELSKPFIFDESKIAESIKGLDKLKMIYLVNPNNPCGYLVSLNTIENLVKLYPNVVVIVDEAYIEFSDQLSAVSLIEKYPNIIIARTFSKAFGLAGVRVGYLCGNSSILNVINKIRNGKNVSMLGQKLATYALRNLDKVFEWVNEVKQARSNFCLWLKQMDLTYYESQGNFVMFEVPNASDVSSLLKVDGIYIRNRSSVISNCIRVTIGSRNDMMRLKYKLQNVLSK